MTPYQQLVDEIVLMVNDDRLYNPDEVEALASQYRDAVKEVNKRLLFCDELLQKGFRSEVVQEAERTPNLLDSAAILDFGDLDFFKETVNDFQLTPLPALRVDLASDINACYSSNELVDRTLRQFRLASLSLAPIKERLTLLRRLHMLDATNLGWEEDVLVYERARTSQIQKEIISATKRENLKSLKHLYTELTSPEWTEKPSSTIARSIESTIASFQLNEAKMKIKSNLIKLQSAFQEQDLDKVVMIKELIENIASENPNSIESDGIELIDQVSEWINRQNHLNQIEQKYNNLLLQLDRMLDNRDPYDKVEQVFAAIQRLDKPVSPDRVKRIRSLKEVTDTQSRRKFGLIIAASIVILVTAGISTGLIYQSKSRTRRVAQYDTNLATMIQNNRLDEAEKEIERIEKDDARVAKRPELIKRKTELAAAQDIEQKRINELDEITDQIQSILSHGKGVMAELDKAEALVNSATELARDSSDKASLDRFKTQIITARSANQKRIDDTFLADFKPLQSVAEQKNSNLDSLKTTLERLLQLKQSSSEVRAELVNLIAPVTAQLQNQITAMQDQVKEDEDRNRLINNFDSLSTYLDGLKKFVEIQPRSRNATPIKTVLSRDSEVWQDLEAMEILQAKLKSANLTQMKAADAKLLVAEWKRLSNRLKFHPAVETEPEAMKYVTRISNRMDDDGVSLVAKITDENGLGHPLIQTAKYMCDQNKRAYYLATVPTVNTSLATYSFRMYMDTDLRRTLVQSIDSSDIDKTKSSSPSWQNPVQTIANEITDRLLSAEGKAWDDLMGKLILDIQSSTKIDDFQKFRCLSIVIPVAMKGSYILEEVFGDHMKAISNSNIDKDVNWANTTSNEMNLTRNKAQVVLSRLPESDKTDKILKERLIAPQKHQPGPVYACVGALNRDASSHWNLVYSSKGKSLDGDLYVYDPNSTKPSLRKVGSKTGTLIEFAASGENLLQEFRVVWIHESSNSTSAE